MFFWALVVTYGKGKDKNIDAFKGERIFSIVYPSDIDLNSHMNNARYIRLLNYCRRSFFTSIGVWEIARKHNLNMIVAAQSIRYRRELTLFKRYSINTRIVSFSDDDADRCFFVETRFEDLSGFVCAIHHTKYKIVGANLSCARPGFLLQCAGAIAKNAKLEDYSPNGFVQLWEKANMSSSLELNPKKKYNH